MTRIEAPPTPPSQLLTMMDGMIWRYESDGLWRIVSDLSVYRAWLAERHGMDVDQDRDRVVFRCVVR